MAIVKPFKAIRPAKEYASLIADFVVSEYDAVPQYNVKDFIKYDKY